MQSTLSVLSGGWGAGRGWGRLSPLSLSVGQKVLPLPLDRGTGDFGVSTSGLVNIYDVLVIFFLTMWRGWWIPTAKQPPPPPRGMPATTRPFLCSRGPFQASVSRPKPTCLVQELLAPAMAQQRAPQLPSGKEGPTLLPSPSSAVTRGSWCSSVPPFLQQKRGIGQPSLAPLPTTSSHLALSGLASLSDFLRTKTKKKKKKIIKKAIKNLKLSENYCLLY